MRIPAFCSECGADDLQHLSEENGYRCRRCRYEQYLTSKPAVCAVILRNRRVLLVRDHSAQESWDLPGGFLRLGEPPLDGLRRELIEELNAELSVKKLVEARVDVYGTHGDYSLNLFYEADLISESPAPSGEIVEFNWFDLKDLPPLRYSSTAVVLLQMAN